MTLIVSAMIGQYSVLAADRKQSNLFTILIGKSFLKDITKIRLVSGVAFSGTGRASILNKIKADFTEIIHKNPENILEDDKLTYFNNVSDFKGLNFVVSMPLNTGKYLHKFYLQGKDSYYNYYEYPNDRKTSNPLNVMVLQPADIDFDTALKYCLEAFQDIEYIDKETILLKMKEIFKYFSTASKFVSADFDIVFQGDHGDDSSTILYMPN